MVPARIHLVGIGGAGMASLAEYLLDAGRIVTGTDQRRSTATERLERAGAGIRYGHDAAAIDGAELVVASDAVPAENVELESARRRGVLVLRRADCLDLLREGRRAIMVAGSHGKSTTCAMIVTILEEAGLMPGFALGAAVAGLGGRRARRGGSHVFVAEACEAFRNLDSLTPDIAVITNIDDEHVNHYASERALDEAFAAFAGRAGIAISSGEDAGIARAGVSASITFGLDPTCMVWSEAGPAPFRPRIGATDLGEVALRQPGDHMRRNALAAVAACHASGVDSDAIGRGLAGFAGVARRWQDVGSAGGVRIVDDYAHHPAEIAASLRAARAAAPGRRLVAAIQPLLHSRVERLHEAFAESLALADHVLLLEVDGGGEAARSAGSSTIAEGLRRRDVPHIRYADPDELVERAGGALAEDDLLLVMGGAGMEGAAEQVRRRLNRHSAPKPDAASRRLWIDQIARAWPKADDLPCLFRKAARARPADPALIGPDGPVSYQALDRSSDAVAAGLAAEGVAGQPIGVSLPLGVSLIVCLLGVMKAGSAYLPLDPALPEARRAYMMDRSGAAALISRSPLEGHAVLDPDALEAASGRVPAGPRGDDTAYICFTSGSTGYPKGVGITHAALAALLADTVPRFGIGPGARMLLNTSISFDVSLAEIGGTLAGGGALVIDGTRPAAGQRLMSVLDAMQVTHLSITPTLLASMARCDLPALRYIIACGEPCPQELIETWAPSRRFFNVYGPTETTIYATASLCSPDAEVTIGTAMTHIRTHVLDDQLRPVEDDALGELCLSGPGVASGYLSQPEETARRFVTEPGGTRVYRTGDMVRRGSDGALRYVGRVDEQVKLLGNRIEFGEIEQTVIRQPGVQDAVVCVGRQERPALLCFVQPRTGCVPDLTAIARHLAEWLPESAVPARILPVPTIYLTPSGKKDRRRMTVEYGDRVVTRAAKFAGPRTETERRLAPLWREALGLDFEVGMLDRFAALGGDSLLALTLIARIEKQFDVSVPTGYFGRIATVPQMAVQLIDLIWHRDGPSDADRTSAGRISRQMRALCGHWAGRRRSPDSLIVTAGPEHAACDIFLCCQEEGEFSALAKYLPPEYRLHGMRSGHLVIDGGPGGLRQLSQHYYEEIVDLDPRGELVLAGICQGGTIAQLLAERLTAAGRVVNLLAFIEPGRLRPYTRRAAVFYGEDSFLNPLREGGPGLAPFDTALLGGYSVDLVPGPHGYVCKEPAVGFLAHHLLRRAAESAPASMHMN